MIEQQAITGSFDSAADVVDAPQARPLCPFDGLVGDWWVVHTKSRHEKALAADLDRLGIDCFLPLARIGRRYGTQMVEVSLPLFPCYLFFCGGEEERYATLNTHRAARIIRVADQDRLRYELRQIHTLTSGDQPVDLYPGLRQGRRVRVVRGSLQGLEGIVLRRRSTCRVYVGVDVLGQSAELEIDSALLEVIE